MNISVTDPIGRAIERTKRILFRPFQWRKWFVLGFCAFLAQLGEGGGGSIPNWNVPMGRGGGMTVPTPGPPPGLPTPGGMPPHSTLEVS